ncbi:MAG: ATP-binding cassette domain-containing protein [Bacteroidota bacterium]
MTINSRPEIVIKGARTNNLRDISLRIPHNQLIVVTGISGSGKSSLVFEIIAKEGQRRYFETLPSFARQFMGKLNRPDVDEIEGLSPVIAISQRTSGMHARSTVGTLSDIYDLLRLLYARVGKTKRDIKPSRSLFSFNSPIGKCPRCNGVGKEEQIDLNKLVNDPKKTIREGALAPTLPNGYIMYSQVTIDVLNQVCESEGFNVDIPWNELTDAQRKVILYGSNKIKVPFGKHSLESRLKWTGIKAKPREEGYYKGMIPIMSDILRRDRNTNILKYVHAVTCEACKGARLNQDALRVTVQGKSIAEVAKWELNEFRSWIRANEWDAVANEILAKIEAQIDLLDDLGLGHLTIDRPASTLRASEIQRIRVANQILVPLSDVLYVFDEPSIGLSRSENERLIHHFRRLVGKGNTVIIVEHDLDTIKAADHIIEVGPAGGVDGGEVIFNGSTSAFAKSGELKDISPTYRALYQRKEEVTPSTNSVDQLIRLIGCYERNLKNIDVDFQLSGLNVVSGKSGSGKSSLVKGTLLKAVQRQIGKTIDGPVRISSCENLEAIDQLIFIDHSPIGKTPRSNPATYLGISDHIRDLYASLPESKDRNYTKSRFSFNNKGGRCETCQGAGKIQIGMHFLGNVELVCGTCNGDRFNEETLEIKYKGLSIADCYRLSVNEAVDFFHDQKKLLVGFKILQEIGLGYLKLGQSSATLSGGEAQRIKIANQLQKKDTGNTLYIIIEPSIGLHQANIKTLLQLFDRVKQKGNTIVCIEQNEAVIGWSDRHIELGPDSGAAGGNIVYQGVPKVAEESDLKWPADDQKELVVQHEIQLKGVSTHGLKNIDVRIPKDQLTVVTGLSGSGKSSLVYDTLFAESSARFTESLSVYNRSFLQQNSTAKIQSFTGLGPAIGINRRGETPSRRSTVGTLSGIYDVFRLLYSRIAQQEGQPFTAQHFSFNHHLGACPACEGIGHQLKCDPDAIIVSPEKSIFDGAISTNKAIAYYADINGQFIATLKEVAYQKNWNLNQPWRKLSTEIRQVILYGTGEEIWDVTWEFNTKTRSGTQSLKAKWLGFCHYIDDEYQRKLHNKNITSLEELLHPVACHSCNGSRLKPELLETKFLGLNIHEICQLSIASCLHLIEESGDESDPVLLGIREKILPPIVASMRIIIDLGLGYLSLDRPVSTISGGERQRLTLAGQLSKHLFGVTYVLDEPTVGLDQHQVMVLSEILKKIIANGNTVVVVEHDPFFIQHADYLIEMGPGAGTLGGEVMYQGKVADIESEQHTLTYRLLHEKRPKTQKRSTGNEIPFGVKRAYANNLKNVDVTFYSGQLTAITGVSGSGKSSLMKDVIYASWQKGRPVGCGSVQGFDQFDEVLLIDQTALSQNRLMTPASYIGILEQIKTLFAKTNAAKQAGFKKADFSYQSKNGKCPTCGGHGQVKTSMDFMSDIWLTCDSCHGFRYNDAILSIKYKNRSIGEVLKMTVTEAINFLGETSLADNLKMLQKVGIGHLLLGQSANTLSGGEAQRLKLAASIMNRKKGATLYLFDEPGTGLHYFDLLPLIEVFRFLVNRGDSILFIEHNNTLIEAADRVLTLGPGSGEGGGEII